jgi:hypothetical protein
MDKRTAVAIVNAKRGAAGPLGRTVHFANVNSRKPVWWIDLPRDEVLDLTTRHVDLVLAETDARVHHLRVPKDWLAANIDGLAIRADKDVISVELSVLPQQRFRDVRPRASRLDFGIFLMK